MNLVEQYARQMIADAERRMDAAGIPRVVSVPCQWCGGTGHGICGECKLCNATGKTITDAVMEE
ncbi:MAG: hypothetical protein KGI71_05145 [Patescibacteria group bacterium]|nr:hypothetical protein [Patescibacteria group bacterium]